jgi:hypothetical protein
LSDKNPYLKCLPAGQNKAELSYLRNSINPVFVAVRSLRAAHAHIFDPRSGNRLRYLYQIAGMDVRGILDMDGMRAEGNVGVGDVGGGGDGTQRKVAFDEFATLNWPLSRV